MSCCASRLSGSLTLFPPASDARAFERDHLEACRADSTHMSERPQPGRWRAQRWTCRTEQLSCLPALRVSFLLTISVELWEIGPEVSDGLVVLDPHKCHA